MDMADGDLVDTAETDILEAVNGETAEMDTTGVAVANGVTAEVDRTGVAVANGTTAEEITMEAMGKAAMVDGLVAAVTLEKEVMENRIKNYMRTYHRPGSAFSCSRLAWITMPACVQDQLLQERISNALVMNYSDTKLLSECVPVCRER